MDVLTTAQPFVKWVGGKRSLVQEILSRLPKNFRNYHEPFAGGAAVYFAIAPHLKHATLADVNLELVLTYNAIKQDPQALIQKLKYHAVRHSEEYYYTIRSKQPTTLIDIAARFLYLNKTCFNGLYRVNSKGIFNTPMGSYENPNIVQEENILACHQVLQNTNIYFGDFTTVITPKAGDFVYFDPPYHPTDELSFTKYVKQNFTEKDQIRLRDFIKDLHKRGVYIMLSNSKTKFIEDLYRARYFRHHIVRAPRYVNCKPNGRGEVNELLITNY